MPTACFSTGPEGPQINKFEQVQGLGLAGKGYPSEQVWTGGVGLESEGGFQVSRQTRVKTLPSRTPFREVKMQGLKRPYFCFQRW